MKIGRVCGTVVCTVQQKFFYNYKQLIVRYMDPDTMEYKEDEEYVVALDLVDAGQGEIVLIQDEGNSARQLTNSEPYGPPRAVIVGIVDQVTMGEF